MWRENGFRMELHAPHVHRSVPKGHDESILTQACDLKFIMGKTLCIHHPGMVMPYLEAGSQSFEEHIVLLNLADGSLSMEHLGQIVEATPEVLCNTLMP